MKLKKDFNNFKINNVNFKRLNNSILVILLIQWSNLKIYEIIEFIYIYYI